MLFQCEEDQLNKVNGVVPIVEGEDEIKSIIENINWLMDNDRKAFALKKLQGFIWKDGYRNGHLKSQYVSIEQNCFNEIDISSGQRALFCNSNLFCFVSLYDDVVPALKSWKSEGKNLNIYSSGSVEAQKLLFEFSIFGNITNVSVILMRYKCFILRSLFCFFYSCFRIILTPMLVLK